MGASNFSYRNARALYPLFTGMDEDEAEMFDYSDACQDIAEHLDELIGMDSVDNMPIGNHRSYSQRKLGHKSYSKSFGDVDIEVRIVAIITAGYYEGACLDWDIELYQDGVETCEIEDWKRYTYTDMSAGLCRIQEGNASKWVSKMTDKLTDEMEQAFAKIATPYRLIGRASNGETFYEKL
jgi:hypothetical protein